MAALTATTPSAMHPVPSWDETIVPALRKRLEDESHTLSRRMSSLSTEGFLPIHYGSSSTAEGRTRSWKTSTLPFSSTQPKKPSSSAVPRSSLQNQAEYLPEAGSSSRTTNVSSSPSITPTVTKRPTGRRARTVSQPSGLDTIASNQTKSWQRYQQEPQPNMESSGNNANENNGDVNLPTPVPSRPTTPMYTPRTSDVVKPTRIPKATGRGRTPSQSSHGHSQQQTSSSYHPSGSSSAANGPYTPPTPDPSPDLFVADRARQLINAAGPYAGGRVTSKGIALMREPPPFRPGSRSSSVNQSLDDHASTLHHVRRLSNDSDERPFEHWYRGEVSRNGGVGELKIGKRMEMLDIANYGHSLKKRQKATERDHPPPSGGRWRRRADSTSGIGKRESIFLDDERARAVALVMDESPLTDLEAETDRSESSHQSHFSYQRKLEEQYYSLVNGRLSPAGMSNSTHGPSTENGHRPSVSGKRSATPSSSLRTPPPSKIPLPTGRPSAETTPTPSHVQNVSASLPSSSSPMAPLVQRGASEPSTSGTSLPATPVPSGSASPKPGRGKSPVGTANQRSKATAQKLAEKKAQEEKARLLKRGSVAQYPAPPDGGDIADAIPSWTQPVPGSGNWDEVVLPVVARKKGLDGQYEHADGSPRPKQAPKAVEPAPGTFGFDKSKYRPSRDERASLDDFGHPMPENDGITEEEEDEEPAQEIKSMETARPSVSNPPPRVSIPKSPSPLPFAHYAPNEEGPLKVPKIMVTRSSTEHLEQLDLDEAANKSGCCKCVIM